MTSDAGTTASHAQSGAVPAGSARWRTVALVTMSVLVVGLIAMSALLWSRTADLQDTVTALQHPAAASSRSASGKPVPTDAQAITKLTTCVNSYMKTVGVWSANVNGAYRYTFC